MAMEESSSESHENCSHHVVLDQATEWSSILWHQVLPVGGDWRPELGTASCSLLTNVVGLGTCQLILGKMSIHFIAVKVSIVALAIGIM